MTRTELLCGFAVVVVEHAAQSFAMDPTGDGDDEECPGLDRRAHDGFYLALPIKAETRLSKCPR